MRILFLLLFVVPLIELYFLIQLGDVIGALPTVLLTIFTAILGVILMRSQGLATLQNAQIEMAAGKSPQTSMLEGVFIFLGGMFLFFPGLISDTIGFLFLIPFVRRFLIKHSLKGFQSQGH
ncbi:MAG TPA: FxsA family protein, partial [Thiomicrospira sp.]|nr:FxsA family protein [Thiomicrospira sp.]